MRRFIAAVALMIGVSFVSTGAAWAWTYGVLNINDADVGLVGKVKGDFNQLTSGTGVGGTHQRYDTRPGGSGIHTDIDYYFYGPYCTADGTNYYACWDWKAKDQTSRWFDNTWSGEYESQGYMSDGDRVRGVINGCMDKRLVKDPCSVTAIKTYDY